ncbi:MAG TPA: alkaline phosphatase family protein [Pseudolysinimonas sp.]|nr:alkaline phosphatase family protein [Pseudolysinimonas sp.]
MSGVRGSLGLASVSHAVVLLIDGLGSAALESHRGHARTLASAVTKRSVISSGFPSTTASSLPTLTTGSPSGQHGMVGYRVFDPERDRVVNELSGWDAGMDPATWQPVPTVFEKARDAGVRAVAIGAPRYRDSKFTAAVLRGAEYVGARTLDERFSCAIDELRGHGPALIYLYVPELDVAAHSHGMNSHAWVSALESLEGPVASLISALGPSQGLLVTADHGIVDVASAAQVIVDPALLVGVRHVAGEPRCLQLQLEPGVNPDGVAERWRASQGARAWVATRSEAVTGGWFGEVDPAMLPRIGHVIVAARADIAYYLDANDTGRRMVGQHGSLTAAESQVPLLRFGAFAD